MKFMVLFTALCFLPGCAFHMQASGSPEWSANTWAAGDLDGSASGPEFNDYNHVDFTAGARAWPPAVNAGVQLRANPKRPFKTQ